jgi:hypothetical protein
MSAHSETAGVQRKSTTAIYWVIAGVAFAVAGWLLNLATYNWFAADFHGPYSRVYASRGNWFFFGALVFFAICVCAIIALLQRRRKRRTAKT